MESETQPHHQQENQSHDQLMHQDQQPQMQFASNQAAAGFGQTHYDHQQPQQRQQQQQHQHQLHSTMSPIATTPVPLGTNQGHTGVSLNPQHQSHLMDTAVSSGVINQGPCNQQPTSHVQLHQQQQQQQQQQQKSQILPLLLSPRPPNLKSSPGDRTEQSENDHDQIIDQVLSLENEFNDSSNMIATADDGLDIMVDHQQSQQQQHQQQQQQQLQLMGDMNITSNACLSDSNQLSSSSEDLLNLLLELDREPSNLIGLGPGQQLDQDEKIGIENIRKQLMSCEVQSDQVRHQNNSECMSPIMNQQMTYQPQQSRTPLQQQQLRPLHQQQQQHHNNAHQQQQMGQVVSQTSPVMPQHQPQQPQHHMSSPNQQQHTDQSLSTGSYSNLNSSTVPVSTSAQSYAPPQHQQSVSRVSQTNPLNIVGNSPSPSWQPPLSPYSPQQNPHSNSRVPSQHQQGHGMHQHSTTSSQLQQMQHHPLQRRSPSHSVSPPATTEPSPVVKKNPLLNAQLVNSRAPSITPTRFMNSQTTTSVLNQNPILNAKLSQSPYCANTASSGTSPVPNPQTRYIQSTTTQPQSSNFDFGDVTQHQQQHNAQHQQHTTPPQSGHMTIFRPNDQQQQEHQQQLPSAATSQAFRTTPSPAVCSSPITMLSTSPSGGLSQQVKDEIRRKVQQPKQHQTTSLLKQLLSDDNK